MIEMPAIAATSGRTHAASTEAPQAQGFGDLLTKLATDAKGALETAERVSVAGLRGEASTREVVEATMRAEQSLQTVLAVRDKAFNAIQDILKTAI